VQPLAPDQCLAFFPGDERVAGGGSNMAASRATKWRRTGLLLMLGRPHWSVKCVAPGAQVQLAIAPAAAGKTTAMRALT
jgi:hypothetical protein